MQIFLPYKEPIKVAKTLDRRRLNKQIIEVDQIISAIERTSDAWKNHPVVKMYGDYLPFLSSYKLCLKSFYEGNIESAKIFNKDAIRYLPPFITNEFCDQHKRRLYTKDPEYYSRFERYGTSNDNWYIVDNELLIYNNGNLISKKSL